MALILTSKGMLEESTLVKSEGKLDNDNECTTWQEWRLGDEIVKRDVQMKLKKAAVFAEATAAKF